MSRATTEREIEETLGLVPSFFDGIPDDLLDAEWMLFKNFEFADSHIPPKYKQLMGVALHSYTAAARLNGATEDEIQEAAHFAKHSTGWSSYMNGTMQDFDLFAKELHEVGAYLSSN